MIITLSGRAGTGKSTVARRLAKELSYKHYSMGDLQREIAKEKGITVVELGELEKTDPSIDNEIDERQRKLGEKEDDFVIDSWLGAHFIPESYKVFLDADVDERANRVLRGARRGREAESYTDLDETVKKIKQRESTNRKRWIEFYGYDFLDMKNYDSVIDTTGKSVDQVFREIYNELKAKSFL